MLSKYSLFESSRIPDKRCKVSMVGYHMPKTNPPFLGLDITNCRLGIHFFEMRNHGSQNCDLDCKIVQFYDFTMPCHVHNENALGVKSGEIG